MSTAPNPYGATCLHGTVGGTLNSVKDIRGFTPGQIWYKGFYYRTIRNTGTNHDTVITKVRWWDGNGTELTATTNSIDVNGNTSGYLFYEAEHLAPANAVRGRLNFTISPGGATMQHDIHISGIRFAKTQFNSTFGAQSGVNLTDSTGVALGDTDIDNGYNYTQAQSTHSLFFNQNFDLVVPGSNPLRPQGVRGAASGANKDVNLGYVGSAPGSDLSIGVGSSVQLAAFFPMWRCNPKATYRVRGLVKGSSSATSGFFARFLELDSEPSSSVLYLMDTAVTGDNTTATATRSRAGGTTALSGGQSVENAALTTAYQAFDITVTPTATAKMMGFYIIRATILGAKQVQLSNLIIEEITPTSVLQMDYTGALNATFGADWSASATGRPIELTDGRVAFALTSGGFLVTSLAPTPVTVAGVRYFYNKAPSYTAVAGSPATATLSLAAGTLTVGSHTVSYNAMSANITGTGGTTVTYYLYVDDATYAGGTQTLHVTTSTTVPYQADARMYLGEMAVTFPTSGSSGGTGTGGGGGNLSCPWEDAFVHTARGWVRAKKVIVGDRVLCLREDGSAADEWAEVTGNEPGFEPSFVIYGHRTGARVTVSESTPITLRDGSTMRVAEIDGHELPFEDDGAFWWEPCSVVPVGMMHVRKIKCGGRTYSAGDVAGCGILTHNPKP